MLLNWYKIKSFQHTVPGSQTQQQMEIHIRPEQIKSVPQSREIQDGDTRNHQDISPTRGVGHLNRLQGSLLPYPNTGTIQEISVLSCRGSDIPVEAITIRSVHSTLGVHCSRKEVKLGHTQGHKNAPVPRSGVSHTGPVVEPPRKIQTLLS